ncbi:hypothetical protein [Salsipaludibacter albus]|uniref:hypothetical protein n=1 Tax=Salsipaludibacter albus TaxID=2849650 RepID=UPI001EE3F2F6|nr:hypothetical protein [Salsipaludibacter albus]
MAPPARTADLHHRRVTVLAAPPDDVWPWLVQIGDGRAGWYSLDLLERVIGLQGSLDGWRSLDRIAPELQALDAGDTVPLGRGAELVVATRDRPRLLEFHHRSRIATTDLALVWRFALRARRRDDGDVLTRLETTTSMWAGPGRTRAVALQLLLGPGHRVMEAAMVRGLRRRVERGTSPTPAD